MGNPRAFECELIGQEDLGCSYALASNAGRAKYVTALSAHDAGYLNRPNPSLVRCRRSPQHDLSLQSAKKDFPYSADYLYQSTSLTH